MVNQPTRIAPELLTLFLVKPSKYDDDGYVVRYRRGFLPSNTLTCLSALTEDVRRRGLLGERLRWDIRILDDTVQAIPVASIARNARRKGNKTVVCLVGVQSNQFPRASDLAMAFRREGIDVLIGGFHVSGSMAMFSSPPQEIRALTDAGVTVVAGEVEDHWGEILRDALDGRLLPVYSYLSDPPELGHQPMPRTEKKYLRHFVTSNFGTIDCGRGCPYHCSFCTIINVQGHRMRCRNAETLILGVRDAYHRDQVSFYFLTDDNFARNPHWEEILDGLIGLREIEQIPLEFMMQVDALAYRIPGFISKAKRAGCTQVFIGLESLNPKNLAAAHKNQNRVEDLANMISSFHAADIMTHAAYMIGFPLDTPASVREDVSKLEREIGVKQVSFFMYTPLPGSCDHRDLANNGTRLDPDLNRYDAFHTTMPHPGMSGAEWARTYREAWESFYGFENMKRILLSTTPERYWNVFKNFIWAKSSVFIEHQHPMVAGFLRRKERLTRRPGLPIEPYWQYVANRLHDMARKLCGWRALFMQMEELWLQTRKRSEREELIVEEIRTIRSDIRDWRLLRTRELQEAYRRAMARLAEFPAGRAGKIRIPSRLSLFLAKHNMFSSKITYSREHLESYWRQTLKLLRRGKIYRVRWHSIPIFFLREVKLFVRFTIAILAEGIR